MAWTFTDRTIKPVVKHNGKCRHPSQHKYCPYWVARHSRENRNRILTFYCKLFDEEKTGYASLPQCNTQYGRTYEGKP